MYYENIKRGVRRFLFGNTKKFYDIEDKSILPETKSKIIDSVLVLVLCIQTFYLASTPYIFQNFFSENFEVNFFIFLGLIIYSVIEAIKNFFQLNNYGENEFTQSKFSILFMVIQGAISYSFIWLMYIILDIVIGENQNIRSNILFFLVIKLY